MADRKPQDQDRYIVRFPDGMRDRLKDEAVRNNRSLNAEIISRLSFSLGFDDVAEVPGHDRVEPTVDDIIDSLERARNYIELMRRRGYFPDETAFEEE